MAIISIYEYQYTSDGVTFKYPINFEYLAADEIYVDVDGTPVDYTLEGSVVHLQEVPELGTTVTVGRNTNAKFPKHRFAHGSPLLPIYLDENFLQALHAVQEAVKSAEDATDTADGISGTAVLALQTAQDALALIEQVVSGSVYTFNGRAGTVLPEIGDYSVEMVTNAASRSDLVDLTGILTSLLDELGTAAQRDVGTGPGNVLETDAVAQTQGTSTRVPMSQNAVTQALGALAQTGDLSTVYTGPYGLTWSQATDTYIRTGASGYASIQSMLRRCVLNADGTVNYFLNPTNSNFKEDGTPANLTGLDGNVMVQVPKFYVRYTMDGTLRKMEVSLTPEEGFEVHRAFIKAGVEVDYRYQPAYRGALIAGKLRSVSGVNPTTNRTIVQSRADCIANGEGWHLDDWLLYCALQTLCVIEIGTLNTQSVLGNGNHTGSGYTRVTGPSNTIGNASSNSSTVGWMSYRGIEDFYASSWQFLDGINLKNYEVFVNDNHTTFASDVFDGDYVSTGISVPAGASTSYIKDLHFGPDGIIPTAIGGSSNTYVTDALWSATGNQVAICGGDALYGRAAGAFCLSVNAAASGTSASVGAGVSF